MKPLIFIIITGFLSFNGHSQKLLADSLVTKELLQHYVQALAHDSMQGRYTGSPGCEKAATWIAAEMNSIGLKALNGSSTDYFQPYNIKLGNDTVNAVNVIGFIPGRALNRYIIFSAHYDHLGDAREHKLQAQAIISKSDKIYNGANDNASGVAAMLALARFYRSLQNNYYSILFVAFSGEENGLLGSTALARSFTNLQTIRQVVNLEMLGRLPANRKKPFVTEGENSLGFVKKLNENLRSINPFAPKKYFLPDALPAEHYFMRSDNYSFAVQGVPANTIIASTAFDQYYHSPFDEWQTLNYEEMADIVRAIALACIPFLQKEEEIQVK